MKDIFHIMKNTTVGKIAAIFMAAIFIKMQSYRKSNFFAFEYWELV